jgi:hypothetical protein
MTLHCHKVDDHTLVEDGQKPVHVPAGWEIAPGDADDIRVCGAHPWQSDRLVFVDGDHHRTFHMQLKNVASDKLEAEGNELAAALLHLKEVEVYSRLRNNTCASLHSSRCRLCSGSKMNNSLC